MPFLKSLRDLTNYVSYIAVRCKIADKNDIKTACLAVNELQHFFDELEAKAVRDGTSQWSLFQQLAH